MPNNNLDNQNLNQKPPTDDEENVVANNAPNKEVDPKLVPTPQVTTNPGIKNY